ncbi:hypothetical protein EON65_57675 [archaeon]|nr:MAG: hypothetical protein EON65_57675 [archaeon]
MANKVVGCCMKDGRGPLSHIDTRKPWTQASGCLENPAGCRDQCCFSELITGGRGLGSTAQPGDCFVLGYYRIRSGQRMLC